MSTCSSQRLVRCVEHDIAVHTHVKPVTDRDFDCRLNVQILASNLGSKIGHLLSNGATGNFGRTGICQNRAVLILRYFGGCGEEARQHREAEEPFVVAVDLVAKAGKAMDILTEHSVEVERGAVRIFGRTRLKELE